MRSLRVNKSDSIQRADTLSLPPQFFSPVRNRSPGKTDATRTLCADSYTQRKVRWYSLLTVDAQVQTRAHQLVTVPTELQDILTIDPEILSGAVRFVGTRVRVQALIDSLDRGEIQDFLVGWPNVPREGAECVTDWEQNTAL